jgi:two-component system, cell cycle sensor histidine kinase and response regulator CckA
MNGYILIVDDNPYNLRVLEEILTSDGHNVHTANGWETAFKAAAKQTPDLILLDVVMPGMDGFKVCRHLKANPATAATPILFISSLDKPEDKLSAFQAGGVDYIGKPFEKEEVLARVRTHLRLAAAQEQLERTNRELKGEIEARKTAEEQYRAIFEQCPDSMGILDPETMRFVDFNTVAHTRLGYTRDEFAALRVFDIVEGYTPEKIAERGRILDEKGTATFELRDRMKTGEMRDILVSVRKMVFNGRPMTQSVVKDITRWKRMEVALRESEKKYRTLFEASKDTILVSDNTGRILDVNLSGLELFGYTRQELLGLDPVLLYTNPDDRQRLWQKLLAEGFVNDYEVEMNRKNGDKIIVHLSVSIIRDDEGNIYRFRGIAHDVTARRRLEQQLIQAQKMESLGLFAGGVAHDFNNLLTAISGYGQIIRDAVPAANELIRDSIDQVLNASDRAAELTRGLLAFSRKQVINPKPVLIDTIIGNAGKLIQRLIGEDIEFSISSSGQKLLVMADVGQLNQVLMNLAANARDAMPNGGCLCILTREVAVQNGSEGQYDLPLPGRYVHISVTDTGSGMDEKHLARIFEPFFTTKEAGKGTGLGLAMIYGAVKQHNGSVLVNSAPGKGTVFNIYLPIIEGSAVKEEKRVFRPYPGGTETLLIAEDEEIVKVLLQRTLERAGYKVITAGDGEEAVALFKHHDDISLVLSDVIMPKMNGKQILNEVRRIKPEMKVMFISGYTADIIHGKGIIEKDVDFIAKPFLKTELLRKIRELLDK